MIHKDFYERGRYVAYNRDVRYSPTHSELSDQTRLDCVELELELETHCTSTAKVPSYCKSWTSVASSGDSSYLLDDNDD